MMKIRRYYTLTAKDLKQVGLQGSLGVYSLGQPILDLAMHPSVCEEVWGLQTWGLQFSDSRFWIWRRTRSFARNDIKYP